MSETGDHVPPDKTTYAVKAGGNAPGQKGKRKLNVLDIILERRAKEVDFNLSKDELGKLLFQKLKLKPEYVIKKKCQDLAWTEKDLCKVLSGVRYM